MTAGGMSVSNETSCAETGVTCLRNDMRVIGWENERTSLLQYLYYPGRVDSTTSERSPRLDQESIQAPAEWPLIQIFDLLPILSSS